MKQAHAEVQEENREFDEDALEEDEGIGWVAIKYVSGIGKMLSINWY